MICPRCRTERVSLLVSSPVGKEWEMYLCGRCNFSWRSTEGPEVTDPARYRAEFALSPEKIANMMVNPPLPGDTPERGA